MTSPEKAMTPTEALEKFREEASFNYFYGGINALRAQRFSKSRLVLAEALADIERNFDHEGETHSSQCAHWCRCCNAAKALIEAAGGGE